MNDLQQLAFELRLDELRRLTCEASDLSGCLLAACSAHRAVRFRSLCAVDLLLETGADVHLADRKSWSTALHRAVVNSGAPATAGKTDAAIAIVRSLLSHGADSTAKNKKGKTPTDYPMGTKMSLAFNP
jgi:tankyrase